MADTNINEIIANPGAERNILANCLRDPQNIILCESEGLLPKHFAVEANKIIYTGIVYLFTKNASIDALSIINIVKDEKAKQEIDKLGGLEYILLLQQAPYSANLKLFCQDIIQCYVRRSVFTTCTTIQNEVLKTTKDVDTILGEVNQNITNIALDSSKINEAYKMGSKLEERLEYAAKHVTQVPGLPSGWKQFDRVTHGGQAGDLIIVVAEAKTGKSVTLLNWAKYQAIDLKLPILWIDSEQSEEEQESRLISIVSQVPESEIFTGLYTEDTGYGLAKDKIDRLRKATKIINESEFYHIYMPDFSYEKIQALTRKFHLKHGIVALYFDYINFNPSLLAQNRQLRDDMILTNLAIGLKDLAGNLKIPVYTASQENRGGYGSTEKDARNIAGSIGILQKASKLIFLRNFTDEELALNGANGGNQKLMIKYQRHGDSNIDIDLHYDKYRITQREV